MKKLILLSFFTILFSSCLEKMDTEKIKNTKWILTEMPGNKLPTGDEATLNFSDDLTISGKAFCNSYGGKFEVLENKISVKNVFSTKMYCQETAQAETAYLNAINQVNNATMEDGKLQLLNDKKVLLIFSKSKATE
ncbi:META domain-containing protein [Pedobacter changchengzhani]|uniref:META domain-containing protein n=1 Tax=Pedobacter changchengzhani TaxID=2529274 RepID=A0A4R5MLX2_9SPHI|nr:META domain-containing protein [Pedobacter changchengzhani]TDG36730.1 META domain-containing protein [Pedobacter changchengzhani]